MAYTKVQSGWILEAHCLLPRMESDLDFRVEAERSLKEVAFAVLEGELSHNLVSSSSCAYINLTTKEGKRMTIRVGMRGFEVRS